MMIGKSVVAIYLVSRIESLALAIRGKKNDR